MSLCSCPIEGKSRPVLLEIGDYSRIVSVTCPSCGEYVIDPRNGVQMDQLYADDLLVTMTTVDDDAEVYVPSFRLTPPAAELLERAE